VLVISPFCSESEADVLCLATLDSIRYRFSTSLTNASAWPYAQAHRNLFLKAVIVEDDGNGVAYADGTFAFVAKTSDMRRLLSSQSVDFVWSFLFQALQWHEAQMVVDFVFVPNFESASEQRSATDNHSLKILSLCRASQNLGALTLSDIAVDCNFGKIGCAGTDCAPGVDFFAVPSAMSCRSILQQQQEINASVPFARGAHKAVYLTRTHAGVPFMLKRMVSNAKPVDGEDALAHDAVKFEKQVRRVQVRVDLIAHTSIASRSSCSRFMSRIRCFRMLLC
jgi:hypothetical protein